MLTAEIKSKIDSARNILVGKIPTPTGQVEQITLALVYKFMNDIDEQNKELGGELKFFTGEYSKYAWEHLLDKSLSAYERVTAYGEGLEKMHLNPNLPQFFRNVFKGAFLPFRDPEVLTIFLKQIDEFRYGANGDLGDAFEYLLQVMGTQGDAGQFLTPRHIINFIVSIVDPQKTDKILDPAEGTAGFLISSFLHILKNNTKPDSNLPGSALTYDERKKLSENLVGYDISHDMVRLSLVNLYLHGFADPKIYEYDTLGNLDRWDDDFDCILTNPPFMTPKGGVKPHKRFSIQAKRSEVLFVDYIMEHLNPNGKAGIIVPEGIIFQAATAYKALRKMMIDQNFLYAVVSLPAGIFNPYSGVKTSVLLMDRVLAKKTKDILFVKIENDGFDLGAQRRPIDKNDLPQATEILKRYKLSLQLGNKFELYDEERKIANLVPIEKISKSGDYNLTGDRFRKTNTIINHKWSQVELDDVCELESGSRQKGGAVDYGVYSIGGEQISEDNKIRFDKMKYITENHYNEMKKGILCKGDVLMVKDGATTGKVGFWDFDYKAAVNEHVFILRAKNNLIESKLLFNLLRSNIFQDNLQPFIKGIIGGVSLEIKQLKIPLPPIEVQQEIVAQLDSYQKIIDGAKQVVDNYKPEIKIDPDWEMVELGEVCERIMDGTHFSPVSKESGDFLYITAKNIKVSGIDLNKVAYVDEESHKSIYSRCPVVKGDVLFIKDGATAGIATINNIDDEFSLLSSVAVIRGKTDLLLNSYLVYFINSDFGKKIMLNEVGGVAITRLTLEKIKRVKIPLPPLELQKQIVARIEEEQQLVDANKKLIELYQGKIKEKIDEVWGE